MDSPRQREGGCCPGVLGIVSLKHQAEWRTSNHHRCSEVDGQPHTGERLDSPWQWEDLGQLGSSRPAPPQALGSVVGQRVAKHWQVTWTSASSSSFYASACCHQVMRTKMCQQHSSLIHALKIFFRFSRSQETLL